MTIGANAVCMYVCICRSIIARCQLAPFGRREATLVDTAVRNTWQLDPSQFAVDMPGRWVWWCGGWMWWVGGVPLSGSVVRLAARAGKGGYRIYIAV